MNNKSNLVSIMVEIDKVYDEKLKEFRLEYNVESKRLLEVHAKTISPSEQPYRAAFLAAEAVYSQNGDKGLRSQLDAIVRRLRYETDAKARAAKDTVAIEREKEFAKMMSEREKKHEEDKNIIHAANLEMRTEAFKLYASENK